MLRFINKLSLCNLNLKGQVNPGYKGKTKDPWIFCGHYKNDIFQVGTQDLPKNITKSSKTILTLVSKTFVWNGKIHREQDFMSPFIHPESKLLVKMDFLTPSWICYVIYNFFLLQPLLELKANTWLFEIWFETNNNSLAVQISQLSVEI